MHFLQGSLVGLCLWAAVVAAAPNLYTVAAGPLIVSAAAAVLGLVAY